MINIFANDKLIETLKNKNIDIKDYVPAYNGESAGLDLYNVSDEIVIKPTFDANERVLIPTGIRVIIPQGYVGLVQERGSVTKSPLKVRAGVIDCGYTGEVFVNCINTSNDDWIINSNSKLPFQLVVVKCDNEFNIISKEKFVELTSKSKRKEGSVGSSD